MPKKKKKNIIPETITPKVIIGKLISRVNYPLVIGYKDQEMMIAPKRVLKNIDKSRLGPLPKGVIFVA